MPLNNLFRRIDALIKFDIEKETIQIINDYGWYISALLRLQLQEGKDSDGEPTTVFGKTYYADRTVFDKEHGNYPALGKQTEFITLYKTGAFYQGLRTIAEGTVFRTESDVPYFEDILRMSGEKIIKLNKENLLQFSQEILIPQLRERYRISNGL